MAKEEKDPKGTPTADPDEDFWKAEGVTDDEEKEAIRSRARVIRYHEHQKALAEKNTPGKKKTGGKWFEKD